MRDYELVYILDPDLSEEVVAERMERFKTLADNQGAEIKSQERWERRRLAYEIKDKRDGIYVVMELNATPAAVHEMDRILKISDGVLRHLIVRAPEGKAKLGKEAAAAARTQAAGPTAQAAVAPGAAASSAAATDETPIIESAPVESAPVESAAPAAESAEHESPGEPESSAEAGAPEEEAAPAEATS